MKNKINNLIPTIYAEMASDDQNDSERLLNYYMRYAKYDRAVINEVMLYLCGWSFETLLDKSGIKIDKDGEPILA
jgi:hypothetical protein